MDHQATLIDRARPDSSAQALTQSLASIAQDMVMIGELQGQLLAADLRTLRQETLPGLVAWLMACVLLVAALPIALVGTGLWLADVAQVSMAAGLLWVALAATLLAAGLLLAGWRQLKRQRAGLQRSAKEFRASLAAIRQALSSHAGRASED